MTKTTIHLGGMEVDLMSITSMPSGVGMFGLAVLINCGCQSPQWVNELVKTNAGVRLLRRVLIGLIAKEVRDDIRKEIEEGVASFNAGK